MFTINPQVHEEPEEIGTRLMCVMKGFENCPETYEKTEAGWALVGTDDTETFEVLRAEFSSVTYTLEETDSVLPEEETSE